MIGREMKRFVSICIAVLLGTVCLSAKSSTYSQLAKLAGSFDKVEGFEVLKMGGLMMDVMKFAMKCADSDELEMDDSDADEMKTAMAIMSGVKGMLMVDYEDASEKDRARFNARAEEILSKNVDLIMETTDDGELVRMYGKVLDDGATVQDFIIFSPDDGALMCFNGKLALSEALKMAESDD